ncbi:ABC transporter permease, partial [Bowmanella yangjiangensis]|nr:hypothetical protein [Bowmanella yangjiangensis]
MATQKSWVQRCLTPKVDLPGRLVLGVSGLCWLLVLGLWAVLSYGGVVPSMFLPTPGDVVAAGVRLAADGTLSKHVLASLEVVLIGFVVSSLVAVPLGLLMGSFR